MSRSMVSSVFITVLVGSLAFPAQALSQVCLGNSADRPKVSSGSLSTGGSSLVDLPLHMAQLQHIRGAAFFGTGTSVYTAGVGALTGIPDADQYKQYAGRGEARWVFGLPVPSAVPSPVGACFSVGLKGSMYGYTYDIEQLDQLTEGTEIAAWHFHVGIPVTLDFGYQVELNESLSVVPFLSPGVDFFYGGTVDESVSETDESPLQSGTDIFTRAGVALNHRLFRVGLLLEGGLAEYGEATRIGIEAGVRW